MTVKRCCKPCSLRTTISIVTSHQPRALELCIVSHMLSKSSSSADGLDSGIFASGGSVRNGESKAIRSNREVYDVC